MGDLKVSVVIPYKQRLDNLRLSLSALAEQTMDSSEFEVVIGAMEYTHEYLSVCHEFLDRITVVSVLTTDAWNAQRARNLAIQQASGQVLVVLDVDMVVPADFLETLYRRYFLHGQNQCVVGQMIGYDEVYTEQVDTVEVRPYDHYRAVLAELRAANRGGLDSRWSKEYASARDRFPWAFARTALMALPLRTVHQHGLLLDEGFDGWGPEDQEWGFRIALSGTPLVLADDIYAVHLPHARDQQANDREAKLSNRYYLGKWPRLDLELAIAFGWLETDRCIDDVRRQLAVAAGPAPGRSRSLGTVRGLLEGRDTLLVGAVIDPETRTPVPDVNALFDPRATLSVLPLAGFSLPYPDDDVDVCRVLPPISRLGERFRDAVIREAERVGQTLSTPPDEGPR